MSQKTKEEEMSKTREQEMSKKTKEEEMSKKTMGKEMSKQKKEKELSKNTKEVEMSKKEERPKGKKQPTLMQFFGKNNHLTSKKATKPTASCFKAAEGLDSLPPEFLKKICVHLGRQDLLSFRTACTSTRDVVHAVCYGRVKATYSTDQLESLGVCHHDKRCPLPDGSCNCLELCLGFAPWRHNGVGVSCQPVSSPGIGAAPGLTVYALVASANVVFVFYSGLPAGLTRRRVSAFSRASSAHLADLEDIEDDCDLFTLSCLERVGPVTARNTLVFPGRGGRKLTVYNTEALTKLGDIDDFAGPMCNRKGGQEVFVNVVEISRDRLIVLAGAARVTLVNAYIFIYRLDAERPQLFQLGWHTAMCLHRFNNLWFEWIKLGPRLLMIQMSSHSLADKYKLLVYNLPQVEGDKQSVPLEVNVPDGFYELHVGGELTVPDWSLERSVIRDDMPLRWQDRWQVITFTHHGWGEKLSSFTCRPKFIAEDDDDCSYKLLDGTTVVRVNFDDLGGGKIDKIQPPYVAWEPIARVEEENEDLEDGSVGSEDFSEVVDICLDQNGIVFGYKSSFKVFKFVKSLDN